MNGARTESDEELAKAAKGGSRAAFEELLRRHFPMVHALAYARLNNRESAEDLAQEVFLRAYLHLGKLDNPRHFGTWVGRIARNLAEDWRRREQRRSRILPTIPLDDSAEQVKDESAPEAREMIDGQTREKELEAALGALSVEDREVILLHFTEGLSLEEISRQLAVNPTTVGRRIKRALGLLRGDLQAKLAPQASNLRTRPAATTRALGVIAAASALSGVSRDALAAATEVAPFMGPPAVLSSAASTAYLKSACAKAAAGLMAMGKTKLIVSSAVAVAAIFAGTYYYKSDENASVVSAPAQAAGSATHGPIPSPTRAEHFAGAWEAKPGAGQDALVMKLSLDARGALAGYMYSANRADGKHPFRNIQPGPDGVFKFEMSGIKATFKGTLTDAGTLSVMRIPDTPTKDPDAPLILQRTNNPSPMTLPPPRTEVAIDPARLDQFLGDYARDSKTVLAVRRQGNQLVARLPELEPFNIYSESDHEFFSKEVDVRLDFQRGADGRADRVAVIEAGGTTVFRRVR